MGTEAKLSQISTDYIYNETVASFLLLLSSCMEDRQTSAIERLYPLPEALKQLKEKIHRQTAALEETLANAQAKEAAMEEDLAMKKELLDIYRVIHAFIRYGMWWLHRWRMNGCAGSLRKTQNRKKKWHIKSFMQTVSILSNLAPQKWSGEPIWENSCRQCHCVWRERNIMIWCGRA